MSKKGQKTQRHGARSRKEDRNPSLNPSRESSLNSSSRSRQNHPSYSNRISGKKIENNAPLWLFGKHAVLAALKNPARSVSRLLVTRKTADHYLAEFSEINQNSRPLTPEIIPPDILEKILPTDCVHQGIALQTGPLPEKDLGECCRINSEEPHLLLILDQVTDPHNVGAIIRSAAAFGARAIISTDRHSPPESGSLAKSASGALEILPWVRVTNLGRALDQLAEMGYWRLGLDGTAEISIRQADFGHNIALVMGAEGRGLRKGTKSHCDALIKLPIQRTVESLNVSNAAAIALYELSSR